MRKLLAIMVIVAMVCISIPTAMAVDPEDVPPTDGCGWEGCNPAYKNLGGGEASITTTATVGSGGSGIPGEEPGSPYVKCKWEYDLEVVVDAGECPDCGLDESCHPLDEWLHDACPCLDGLQVKPDLGQDVMVGYFAVVSDDNGIDDITSVYADVWHPDGEFKYQVVMEPVGFDEGTGEYSDVEALALWDHAIGCHGTLVTINNAWAVTLPGDTNAVEDIRDELDQEEAYLYYGEAPISYCQPGGWYSVGVTAFDTANHQSSYLYNRFWYIPVAAVKIDFTTVDYGSIEVGVQKQAGGDDDESTANKPTVRNIGNTRVELFVEQDDMDFGTDTDGTPNVHYEARMGADGTYVSYDPEVEVKIPGVLNLCSLDKLDFRITADKGTNGVTYSGSMMLKACIHMNSYIWDTPPQYVGDAPGGVAQIYNYMP